MQSSVPQSPPATRTSLISVIGASSVGTLIEWYDFYIFGFDTGACCEVENLW